MNSVQKIVAKFGSTRRAAARTMQRNPKTVEAWERRGAIPRRQQHHLLRRARALGVALSPADFFDLSDIEEEAA